MKGRKASRSFRCLSAWIAASLVCFSCFRCDAAESYSVVETWPLAVCHLDMPRGIAVTSSGYVFVAHMGHTIIQKFRRDFGMREISWPAVGRPVIAWDSAPDKTYAVWVSGDLGFWVPASSDVPASATGVNYWIDFGLHALGSPFSAGRRFYRVVLQPQFSIPDLHGIAGISQPWEG